MNVAWMYVSLCVTAQSRLYQLTTDSLQNPSACSSLSFPVIPFFLKITARTSAHHCGPVHTTGHFVPHLQLEVCCMSGDAHGVQISPRCANLTHHDTNYPYLSADPLQPSAAPSTSKVLTQPRTQCTQPNHNEMMHLFCCKAAKTSCGSNVAKTCCSWYCIASTYRATTPRIC